MVRCRMVFLYSMPLQEAFRLIEKHDGSIAGWISEGPSGGNPEIYLDFETREKAVAMWQEMNPDDSLGFVNEHISDV